MTTFLTIALWVFVLLAIWAVANLAWQMSVHLNRPERVTVGEFLDNGQPKPEYSTRFYDRWLSFSTAGGELKEAGTDLPFSSGGDFLFAEIEQRTGNELSDTFGELAKDVDLKIAGVSIQGFAKLIDSLSRRSLMTVEGRVSQCGSETILTIALRHRMKIEKAWNLSRTTGSGGTSGLTVEDLMDDAICRVAVYLQTKNTANANRGANVMDNISGLSPEAITSLTKGRRSLNRYMRDSQQTDLTDAQKHFRSLIARSPEYVDGYLMLAYTLAENRQEREAIRMYDRAIDLLQQAGTEEDRRLHQIEFLRGSSLLRCYRWEDAVEAIKVFRSLAGRLAKLAETSKPSEKDRSGLDTWRYNHYLLAMCYAEIGHCFGHLLAFLPKDHPLEEKYRADLPELIGQDVLDKQPLLQQDQETYKDRLGIAKCLYDQSKQYQQSSARIDPVYRREWKHTRAARLKEVSGYAQYRFAEWLEDGDAGGFAQACGQAIRDLREAELQKPRHYALLQNIGMILLNRRYDPQGNHLQEAEDCFKRSIELKPADYYGYGQLACVNLRRMIAATTQSTLDDATKAAERYIANALAIRPASRASACLQLYIELARLYLHGSPVQADDINRLCVNLNRYDPTGEDTTSWWIRLSCEWLLLVRTSDKVEFEEKKASLIEQFSKYEAALQNKGGLSWRTSQMLASIGKLKTELAAADDETRESLTLPIEAALD